MSFFALKISDPNSVELVDKIKSGSQDITVQQLNQLEDKLTVGQRVFMQLGGDQVSWNKGLIGVAEITKAPFDKGYDGTKKNFRLGLKMLLALSDVIKREEFRFYVDAYDAGGIGPNTKGEQNQAIKSLTDKQGFVILRAMVEKQPDLEPSIRNIFSLAECEEIFGKINCMVEKNMTFEEAKAYKENTKSNNDTDDENEYQKAARIIVKYGEENNLLDSISDSDIDSTRDEFLSRFSIDKLKSLSDNDILSYMFLTINDNSNSFCYWLENKEDCWTYFGKIGVGSCLHYGLYQEHADGIWTTKADKDDKETKKKLSEQDAIILAKKIRDILVLAAETVDKTSLNTLDDYKDLANELNIILTDDFNSMQWVHKFLAILFPEKLSCYHNEQWQKHILFSLGIKASDNMYVRSGQIAMIQNYANLKYRQFFEIHVTKYGRPKKFFKLGMPTIDGALEDWKNNSCVGIEWGEIGSLLDLSTKNKINIEKLNSAMDEHYPNDSKKVNEIKSFYETDSNCIFVVADGDKILDLVDCDGTYEFDSAKKYAHLKKGVWLKAFSNGTGSLPISKEGANASCKEIKKDENLFYLYQVYYNETENEEIQMAEISEELKCCLEIERAERTNRLHPMNCIIYGAPGTGKTYSTAEYALAIVRGCSRDTVKAEFKNNRKGLMKEYNNLIKQGQVVFTTFHQSYGYEEFIQGLRPDTKSDKMAFKTVDGVFKHIADVALNDKEDKNYVIIIDEINRANISKVFGELITLIEDDKRWGEVNETCATLQSGYVFAVPNNLYILGTMNSADKSISLIDAALRRRFSFIEQKPESDLVTDSTLKSVLEKLNLYLSDALGSADLLIGHSYFIGRTASELPAILNGNIIPLLYEYFYDNKKSVYKALDDAIKGLNISIVDDKIGRLYVKEKDAE